MGHPRSPSDIDKDFRDLPLEHPADDKFTWTYTSPEFPMSQVCFLTSMIVLFTSLWMIDATSKASVHIFYTRVLNCLSFNQEYCLQKFKLPEPVLCIGGYLQVELLGRVQKQEMDDLYYIWSVPAHNNI